MSKGAKGQMPKAITRKKTEIVFQIIKIVYRIDTNRMQGTVLISQR